ncbi:MAG: radical SAM protein [Planctomycetota bacterium]|jgi:radical SAM protein with 4Fe4S-binding SPASM domain
MATFSICDHGRRAAGEESDFFAARGHVPVPQFVQWMATLRCGLSCPHCLAAGDGGGAPDMPLADVERVIDEVAGMGVPQFLITGGEPTARPDLPEVIDALRRRGQAWEINTAVLPGARLRAAMEKHPPSFAAVSLDGPERVHDRFRGRAGAHRSALEAIRFYRAVGAEDVAAGTTVTTENFAHLSETFTEVISSGATAWGLHLLVPEGRARRKRSLFLSRRQLRRLIDFCASHRRHFPVGMADEIGWLGEDEPLVRDEPFFCGAGRTQCVILPGGDVVPCTTLDRAESAGNCLRRPLREIWRDGFAEVRRWEPEGRCRSCEYARACRGGCWLQRRSGTQCFRHVWRAPRISAAAAAICLGLGVSALGGEPAGNPEGGHDADAGANAEPPLTGEVGLVPIAATYHSCSWRSYPQVVEQQEGKLEVALLDWYSSGGSLAVRPASQDPGDVYLGNFSAGKRGTDLGDRCAAVGKALGTKQGSLSLAALAWRDLCEACLDGRPASKRGAQDARVLRSTLENLEAVSSKWWAQRLNGVPAAVLNKPARQLESPGGCGRTGGWSRSDGGARTNPSRSIA